ncbi:MAG: hypothetical protein CO143_02045 [Candidatus Moranbacteria bacterium CG_4_9_14_3_um_filter_45_14]|nr:MAG: hypothetical protein AUK19_03215 [Candidatus Moranbacteria bacterium CG2_30_45_14]PJA85299.1 MAG: hypothetical protein CO143_02045 [Candidatus Moranbacteria bacterium CG_4_9_14_3_um_filter_45_14]
MVIGIDASRAFLKRRTGIEEYAYQTIKHLREVILPQKQVILYVRKKIVFRNSSFHFVLPEIDFPLPFNWSVRGIWAPRFWTQIALSIEMVLHTPDILFVPAHTVPFIHPARNATLLYSSVAVFIRKVFHRISSCSFEHSVAGGLKKTIVTIHGLEYEFCKDSYSFLDRLYMQLSIRFSCSASEAVICVSENTKKDVMRLYDVPEEKIHVIYEGYENTYDASDAKYSIQDTPYLLFIGRLEERKNIIRIIEAFNILKREKNIPHRLVLVGKPGYGYERIASSIFHSPSSIYITEMGYVDEAEKWELLRGADVFLFPSLYEGFGIPVLEAQSVGVPVVTSAVSSLPEVGGERGAMYMNPKSAESIREGVWKVLSEKNLRNGIIEKATQNVSRFGWVRCAEEIGEML